jgi:hypothetical protein
MGDVATKKEAIESLSKHLRREDLDDLTFVKLLTLYAKLSGWDTNTPTAPSPKKVRR